jgi:SsrA-binding protein
VATPTSQTRRPGPAGASAPKAKVVSKPVASNRQARRDYDILDTLECGLVLLGSEVKSLRESKVQLADAHARLIAGEVWLLSLHIAPYSHAFGANGHNPDRDRKLLLRKDEIERLQLRLERERLSLVPLSLYFVDGRAKLELGVGRGRKSYDKRAVIAARDAARDTDRALARARRND